ncbi:hypothetical protein OB236_14620 [Paenibacillus sp. WQ 127069]|uniref:ABC transporter ATP-binding protein n=1 Tax=Paenibacillus baimaensis TaxID=2982185 RepID=A0ABT2UFC8_9BACL|nr:hypothetical protein [Paenibacillus sp. WQ 127069]
MVASRTSTVHNVEQASGQRPLKELRQPFTGMVELKRSSVRFTAL